MLDATKDEELSEINADHRDLPSWKAPESSLGPMDDRTLEKLRELVDHSHQMLSQKLGILRPSHSRGY